MSSCGHHCYEIGYIGADPECPIHGDDAQRREAAEDARYSELLSRIEALEQRCTKLNDELRYVRSCTGTPPRGMPR